MFYTAPKVPPGGLMRQGFELKKFSCNGAKRQELFQTNRNCPTLTFRTEVITLRRKTGAMGLTW